MIIGIAAWTFFGGGEALVVKSQEIFNGSMTVNLGDCHCMALAIVTQRFEESDMAFKGNCLSYITASEILRMDIISTVKYWQIIVFISTVWYGNHINICVRYRLKYSDALGTFMDFIS